MKIKKTTYLSLGSNKGNKSENLQNAIDAIDKKVGSIHKISSIYKTPSWGFAGNDFYNICIEVKTNKTPENLLKILLSIEKELGRKRNHSENYANRLIDIDILLFENQIIISKDLIIPHAKMLDRNFVLVPLAEIAKNVLHPVAKAQIVECLQNCTDTSTISKINTTLIRPIPLEEKYNYIAIEGNIGAGKTSLTQKISEDHNAKIILERFADNPFLPKFYKDKKRFAFPLEMNFLIDRYQQLNEDFAQFNLFKNFIISDYYIFKSLIFAQVTLSKEEFILYRKMFNLVYKEIIKPDLYIYLYQDTERLLENIKKRARPYEQNIKAKYLDKIQKGYLNFLNVQKGLNVLIINVSEIDFVANNNDYQFILEKIKDN
ncbi:2-amino-4-hydroxy-6-hydroxymethyldihydropteridine diphosphokinase [uncultured Polaribacter sp.]|uniref:2-amino-4-hydroxy-6- hydroxymethyldihydropteridine diphosphokinase n=1 Tax=uncultured Polaribacter sp. TaxID=174711 RepID=UPI00260B1370|nr:2-amino-4-hydroxy-6-hydroxymethyldihydropteridine diphosphokinase [uncultured Polaribacter sp.]